jgi:predicted permease
MRKGLFHLGQAVTGLRRARGYAAAFVVTLGLAIGVNSAVFSVVNGVLLRPLPYPDADRILYLKQPVAGAGVENALFSFMEIDDYRAGASTIDEVVEFGDWEFTVLGEERPHRAVGGLVTSNYFGVMGMRSALGRLLNEEDDRHGAEPVMLLTDAYFERVFGRDPSVVGRTLRLENLSDEVPFKPTRVVGVLEPGLHYTSSRRPDFYVNYATNDHYQGAAMRDARGHRMTDVFARLAPGATVEAARSELDAIAGRLHAAYPENYDPEMGYGIEAVPWLDELTRQGRSTFLLLMGTVAVVLLLAAANVTNLTLTRLIRKEGELATRAALGATRTDLRLHLATENLVLGLAGGALGVLLALAGRDSLAAYAGRFTVRAQEVGVDWTVLGATLGGAMLLAVALAWAPGLPVAPGPAGSASARSKATDSRSRKRLQRGLVVTQLAISFALLTGAGLLVRSLIELGSVDPGFRTEQILTLKAPTGPTGGALPFTPDPGWEHALHEIGSFPGVRAAAVASWTPLAAPTAYPLPVTVEGRSDPAEHAHPTTPNEVSPGYFEMLGIRLVAGRTFVATDRAGSAPVIILNRSMARGLFGDEDPIGRRISFEPDYRGVFIGGSYEVVGVVADTREHGMDTEGVHTFYRPAAQTTWGPAILVASAGDPGALAEHVREVIQRMDPDRAVEDIETMASLLDRAMAPSRLNAVLVGSFAVLALLIAAVGVLGMLAFSVSQRVREFGIRMALGADEGRVLRSVLGEGVLLLTVALVLGTAGALALGRFLSLLLFNVGPLDAVSLVSAASILGAVALGAALVPALRATRILPSEALKAE